MAAPRGRRGRAGGDQNRGPAGPERARRPPSWGSRGPGPEPALMPRGRAETGRRRAGPGSARPGPAPAAPHAGHRRPRAPWRSGPPDEAGSLAKRARRCRAGAPPPPSLGVPGAARAPGRGAGPGAPHPRPSAPRSPRGHCSAPAAALRRPGPIPYRPAPQQPRTRASAAPRRLPALRDVSSSSLPQYSARQARSLRRENECPAADGGGRERASLRAAGWTR
uniref:Basic proline-rich protein-like n=1 Tax=Tursiops truncatus TaxID=9739 RepID=A0A2U4C2P9_TURTR|nr:basic proline-rich protein-like [Tursiops truncatus]